MPSDSAFDVDKWAAAISADVAARARAQQAAASQLANNRQQPGAESALCNAMQSGQANIASGLAMQAASMFGVDRSVRRFGFETMTAGDVTGAESRRKTPDAVAGCRLGCSCKVHRPAKPAPYIPTVDEYDLLPDV